MKRSVVFSLLLASTAYAVACTNFIVGKKASADGAVYVTYNADSYGAFMPLYHYPEAILYHPFPDPQLPQAW